MGLRIKRCSVSLTSVYDFGVLIVKAVFGFTSRTTIYGGSSYNKEFVYTHGLV